MGTLNRSVGLLTRLKKLNPFSLLKAKNKAPKTHITEKKINRNFSHNASCRKVKHENFNKSAIGKIKHFGTFSPVKYFVVLFFFSAIIMQANAQANHVYYGGRIITPEDHVYYDGLINTPGIFVQPGYEAVETQCEICGRYIYNLEKINNWPQSFSNSSPVSSGYILPDTLSACKLTFSAGAQVCFSCKADYEELINEQLSGRFTHLLARLRENHINDKKKYEKEHAFLQIKKLECEITEKQKEIEKIKNSGRE